MANRIASPHRVTGGILTIRPFSVLFVPHLLDRALGGMSWHCRAHEITAVDFGLPDDFALPTTRRWVRLSLTDSSHAYFLFWRPDQAIAHLRLLQDLGRADTT